MKRSHIRHVALAILLAASSGAAMAQYSGPSSIQKMTVQQLTQSGRDDQKAVLVGHIVSHDGGEHYTFDDGTGRIRVEISSRKIPVGQPFDDKRQVELTGEVDKEFTKIEFDVDSVRLL